jgi:hypothetical protein
MSFETSAKATAVAPTQTSPVQLLTTTTDSSGCHVARRYSSLARTSARNTRRAGFSATLPVCIRRRGNEIFCDRAVIPFNKAGTFRLALGSSTGKELAKTRTVEAPARRSEFTPLLTEVPLIVGWPRYESTGSLTPSRAAGTEPNGPVESPRAKEEGGIRYVPVPVPLDGIEPTGWPDRNQRHGGDQRTLRRKWSSWAGHYSATMLGRSIAWSGARQTRA